MLQRPASDVSKHVSWAGRPLQVRSFEHCVMWGITMGGHRWPRCQLLPTSACSASSPGNWVGSSYTLLQAGWQLRKQIQATVLPVKPHPAARALLLRRNTTLDKCGIYPPSSGVGPPLQTPACITLELQLLWSGAAHLQQAAGPSCRAARPPAPPFCKAICFYATPSPTLLLLPQRTAL